MSNVELWGSQGTRSPLVNWYLYEIGASFQDKGIMNNPNPFGSVPCLRDGDQVIFEVNVPPSDFHSWTSGVCFDGVFFPRSDAQRLKPASERQGRAERFRQQKERSRFSSSCELHLGNSILYATGREKFSSICPSESKRRTRAEWRYPFVPSPKIWNARYCQETGRCIQVGHLGKCKS